MHLPWWLAPNPGCLSGRGCGGLGPHGLADRVDLRLPGGQVVHKLLVLHNQLLDLVSVIRQRLLLQVRQYLFSTQQPLHQLVQKAEQVLQLLQMLLRNDRNVTNANVTNAKKASKCNESSSYLEHVESLEGPVSDLVPPGLDDCDPVLDDVDSVGVALVQDLPGQVERVVLVFLLFLQLLHELFVLGNLPSNL